MLEAVDVTVMAAKAVLLAGEECVAAAVVVVVVVVADPVWGWPSSAAVVAAKTSGRSGEEGLEDLCEARWLPLLPLPLLLLSCPFVLLPDWLEAFPGVAVRGEARTTVTGWKPGF